MTSWDISDKLWLVDIVTTIALVATPIVITAGILYARRQCIAMRKARTSELIIALCSMWDSPEMAESRQKVNAYGPNLKKSYEDAEKTHALEAYTSLIRVANFFDALGVQVAEGFLDLCIAYDLFGKTEKTYYALYEHLINAPEYEEYVPYFRKLHELFVKEEAHRSQVKRQRAS